MGEARVEDSVVASHQRDFFHEASGDAMINKKDAVDVLKEAARAFSAGDLETARRYALEAKKLRRDPSWNKDDLERLLVYLRLHANAKRMNHHE